MSLKGGRKFQSLSCSAHSVCFVRSSFLNPLTLKTATDGLIWTDLPCEFRYNQNLSLDVKP